MITYESSVQIKCGGLDSMYKSGEYFCKKQKGGKEVRKYQKYERLEFGHSVHGGVILILPPCVFIELLKAPLGL